MARGYNINNTESMNVSSDTWNTADGFTKLNILRLLVEINLLETVAKFGKTEIDEKLSQKEMALKRVEALEKLIFTLRMLISNCMFAIKKNFDIALIKHKLIPLLDSVESVLDGSYEVVVNEITKVNEININEKHFRKCLDTLSEIKEDLFCVLNRASLIFRVSEETDLDALIYNLMVD